jgi:UDP-2-acetamido-2-deoxy-ribo-hexuluronate aminotransferase
MDQINEIALNHGLPVIEDAAQSFGASYKSRRSCGLSTIGCTSFFPAKPLGAYGDAGACLTHDAGLAHAMREIRNHGQGGRYQHVRIGINGRMDSLQAGVLLSKMSVFDDELDQRNKVARRYSDLLGQAELEDELKLPFVESYNMSSWAQYTVEVNRRELIQERMSAGGIPTAVHYPLPVYAQPAILQKNLDHPNTEKAARRVMSLPMHPYLKYSTQQRVAESLIDAIKS